MNLRKISLGIVFIGIIAAFQGFYAAYGMQSSDEQNLWKKYTKEDPLLGET